MGPLPTACGVSDRPGPTPSDLSITGIHASFGHRSTSNAPGIATCAPMLFQAFRFGHNVDLEYRRPQKASRRPITQGAPAPGRSLPELPGQRGSFDSP